MARLHGQCPDDDEASAFYALALLATIPGGERNVPVSLQAGAIALAILRRNPEHPGANHYALHAFDDGEQVRRLPNVPKIDAQSECAMVDAFEDAGEGYPYNNIELARDDFPAFVKELDDAEQGIGLPTGIVPQTTYILVRDGARVLGEIRFRSTSAPPFSVGHDHIGYNVRPSERQRGYGSFMLRTVLKEAQALNLPGVSLTIEGDNRASIRMIRNHGGNLYSQERDPRAGDLITVYWIPLQPESDIETGRVSK